MVKYSFKKTFENTYFAQHLLLTAWLQNKICKFCHVLKAKYNDGNDFQKLSLNILLQSSFLLLEVWQ